jgi:hypothetical protein
MLRNPLTWLLLFIATITLAGCCGSVACDCQDSLDDAVSFSFNQTAGPSRPFTLDELDSVFFVRQLRRDTARRPTIDTVLLVRTAEQRASSVVLNNAQPFGQRGTRKLNQYRYLLYLGKRRAPTAQFRIDSIQLSSRLQSDGCCTCNNNTLKRVFLNGNPQAIDATDPSGQDRAVPVVLSR